MLPELWLDGVEVSVAYVRWLGIKTANAFKCVGNARRLRWACARDRAARILGKFPGAGNFELAY